MKSLKINECLNFANSVIAKTRSSSPDEILNALFHLALCNVNATCSPGLDTETRQVLALYQVEEALNSPGADAWKIFAEDDAEEEEIIIQ